MTSKLCTLSAVPSCHYAGGCSPTHHSCLDSALHHHTPALLEHSLQCCTGTGPVNSLHIQEEYFVLLERFKMVVSTYTICYNIKNICILLTQCIYVFCMILTAITDYFPKFIYCAALYWRDRQIVTEKQKLRWVWGNFENATLYDLHCPPNIVLKIEWGKMR